MSRSAWLHSEGKHARGGGGDVFLDAAAELGRAREQHPAFLSAHEGYAVLLEELDELWDEVKSGGKGMTPDEHRERMRGEALQVAAMAVKFVMDVCDVGGDER